MRQLAIIAAALLVLCIFPTSIYAMQNNQQNLDPSNPLEAGTPESARDAVISYIISRYGINVEAPKSWTVVDTTPEGLLGYQTLQYTSGDWRVVVKHGLTLTPIYSISIQYSGDNSFTWTGTLGTKISNEEYVTTINDCARII
jgi:hypothetical protein